MRPPVIPLWLTRNNMMSRHAPRTASNEFPDFVALCVDDFEAMVECGDKTWVALQACRAALVANSHNDALVERIDAMLAGLRCPERGPR